MPHSSEQRVVEVRRVCPWEPPPVWEHAEQGYVWQAAHVGLSRAGDFSSVLWRMNSLVYERTVALIAWGIQDLQYLESWGVEIVQISWMGRLWKSWLTCIWSAYHSGCGLNWLKRSITFIARFCWYGTQSDRSPGKCAKWCDSYYYCTHVSHLAGVDIHVSSYSRIAESWCQSFKPSQQWWKLDW